MCNCPLPTEKEIKSSPRGEIDFKVSSEKDICVSRWLDNGVVTLASNFACVEPIDQVRRWSESAKEHIIIDRPHSIAVYNNYMDGVDRLSYFSAQNQSKKQEVACTHVFPFLRSGSGQFLAEVS